MRKEIYKKTYDISKKHMKTFCIEIELYDLTWVLGLHAWCELGS